MAQEMPAGLEPEKQVHWAVAAFFGTGWYQVDDNRSMFIFRTAPRQTLRESARLDDGQRRLGIEIQYPLALGLTQLDDIPDFVEFENYGTVTFTPGVEIEVPVNERWYLRPYANLGLGYERESGEWARIWYGGIKSRYLLDDPAGDRWSLLSAAHFAGYKPEYQSRGQYASVMGGLEWNQPLKSLTLGGDALWLNWHVTYTYLFDNLNFHVDAERVETINDQWELGLALSKGDRKIRIGFLEFEHIGLSYSRSSNGLYSAISLNLRSPFTY